MEGGSHLINTDVDLGYCSVFVEEVRCENAVVPMNCDPLILPFFFFFYMVLSCIVIVWFYIPENLQGSQSLCSAVACFLKTRGSKY